MYDFFGHREMIFISWIVYHNKKSRLCQSATVAAGDGVEGGSISSFSQWMGKKSTDLGHETNLDFLEFIWFSAFEETLLDRFESDLKIFRRLAAKSDGMTFAVWHLGFPAEPCEKREVSIFFSKIR